MIYVYEEYQTGCWRKLVAARNMKNAEEQLNRESRARTRGGYHFFQLIYFEAKQGMPHTINGNFFQGTLTDTYTMCKNNRMTQFKMTYCEYWGTE